MSKIIKTNSNEKKNKNESRCLGDKKGFNDTSQIFTSDSIAKQDRKKYAIVAIK